MARDLFIIQTAVICLFLVGNAVANKSTATCDNVFDDMDTNGDGQVTRPEFIDYFMTFDRNRVITEGEFMQKWTRDNLGTRTEGQQLYQFLDSNNDKIVGENELSAAFRKINNDDETPITREQFIAKWNEIQK